MPCAGKPKTATGQHGAEGPDALQVLIKAPMVLLDLDGCSPLCLCGEIPRPSPIQSFPSEFQERKPCQGEVNERVRKVSRLHRVLGQSAPDYE